MFVTNWISTTKIQKISEITNFFRHYFLSRTEVPFYPFTFLPFYPFTFLPFYLFTFIKRPPFKQKKGRPIGRP